MNPYYKDKWVTIYHGDCREILPTLDCKVDLVLTDPPYPNQHLEYGSSDISLLNLLVCRQLVFWTIKEPFPLTFTATHSWDKQCGTYAVFENIYERNGNNINHSYSYQKIKNKIDAQMNRDIITGHYSQKPQRLITKLIVESSGDSGLILDPFLGSGTTCYCAKKLNRYSIGIEIEEKYCEIAAKRCSQEVMELNL